MSTVVASAPRIRVRTSRANRARFIVVGTIVVAALAFLLWRGLSSATLYFRTADEAVAQRNALGTKRFRIEGTVIPRSIKDNGQYTDFAISSKAITVQVHNDGQPLGIFQENIPVVLEGHFNSANPADMSFDSDRIMVKHSADYDAQHPDRTSAAVNQ